MTAATAQPDPPASPPAAPPTPAPVAPAPVVQPDWAGAAWALFAREWMRFFRQHSRIVGALLTPAVFWVLLGTGLNQAALIPMGADGDAIGYRTFFFPGAAVMVLLFNTIFATYGLIEDKRDGLLRAMLVSPAPRSAAILGKLLGGASIAAVQACVFLLLWPWVAASPLADVSTAMVVLQMIAGAGVLLLIAVGMTAVGFLIAWPMNNSSGLHAILNLLLFPGWFLCGAVFPVSGVEGWLSVVMHINPLTYGMSAFHAVLMGQLVPPGGGPTLLIALPVTVAVVVVLAVGVVQVAQRKAAE